MDKMPASDAGLESSNLSLGTKMKLYYNTHKRWTWGWMDMFWNDCQECKWDSLKRYLYSRDPEKYSRYASVA